MTCAASSLDIAHVTELIFSVKGNKAIGPDGVNLWNATQLFSSYEQKSSGRNNHTKCSLLSYFILQITELFNNSLMKSPQQTLSSGNSRFAPIALN